MRTKMCLSTTADLHISRRVKAHGDPRGMRARCPEGIHNTHGKVFHIPRKSRAHPNTPIIVSYQTGFRARAFSVPDQMKCYKWFALCKQQRKRRSVIEMSLPKLLCFQSDLKV